MKMSRKNRHNYVRTVSFPHRAVSGETKANRDAERQRTRAALNHEVTRAVPKRGATYEQQEEFLGIAPGVLAELLRRESDDGCHDRIVPGGLVNLTDHYRNGAVSGDPSRDPLPLRITMRLRAYRSTPILTRPQVIEEMLKLLRDEPLSDGEGDWLAESVKSITGVSGRQPNRLSFDRGFGGGVPDTLTVRQLRRMPYRRYLRSQHWQSVRREALVRARECCQRCSSPMSLEVHHRTYKRRGHEHASDLVVLCATCHGRFHKRVGWIPFADRYLSSRRGIQDLVELILLRGFIIGVSVAYLYSIYY